MKKNNLTIYRDTFNLELVEDATFSGAYDMPNISPIEVDDVIKVIPFNYVNTIKNPHKYYVHFYIDDYQFERIWSNHKFYMEVLKLFKGVFAPDFSMYADMPKAQQIWNNYRSKAIAHYWQANGIKVIPNACWSDSTSYNWCFDGLPKNSSIAVSSLGCMQNKRTMLNFCKGFKAMDNTLKPTQIYFYGKIPKSLQEDKRIIHIPTYSQMKWNI